MEDVVGFLVRQQPPRDLLPPQRARLPRLPVQHQPARDDVLRTRRAPQLRPAI